MLTCSLKLIKPEAVAVSSQWSRVLVCCRVAAIDRQVAAQMQEKVVRAPSPSLVGLSHAFVLECSTSKVQVKPMAQRRQRRVYRRLSSNRRRISVSFCHFVKIARRLSKAAIVSPSSAWSSPCRRMQSPRMPQQLLRTSVAMGAPVKLIMGPTVNRLLVTLTPLPICTCTANLWR